MKSSEYRSLLRRLPITNPTPQDMAMLCPHLTAEEAVEAFTTGSSYVACPPLRIRRGFQIISYYKERLDWSYTGRTLESYADHRPRGDVFFPYKYMDKAMKFAEDNWGDELILDDWVSVVEFYIQDPTDLNGNKFPRTKAVLYVTLNRDLNEIINGHSKPESERFDDAISQMTLDPVIWHELKGGRGGFIEFNCAHCGAGLSLSSCTGCGHRFRDDQLRCGWRTPLSRKMVEFLQKNGHEFKADPEIARAKERQDWERSR